MKKEEKFFEGLIFLFVIIVISISTFSIYKLGETEGIKTNSSEQIKINVSLNTTEFKIKFPIEPGSFKKTAKIISTITSPYIDSLKEFRMKMSTDKKEWIEFKDNFNNQDMKAIESLGYIDLTNKYEQILYFEVFLPPQDVFLPSNLTKEKFLSSFSSDTHIKFILSKTDKILLSLIFISLGGFLYGLLAFHRKLIKIWLLPVIEKSKKFIEEKFKINSKK